MQPHAHVKLKEATQMEPVTCLGMKILIDAKHQLVKTIRDRLEIQPPVFDPGLAECLLQRRHVLWEGSYPCKFKVEISPEANMSSTFLVNYVVKCSLAFKHFLRQNCRKCLDVATA